ncbi:uncharacterized protein LOC128213161 [Mya arenaria]|uniref:uncharacterized protein LOC128213161 n=1 Tax=Mya arenaria TaxID=6604 RepID=UPI0022E226DC|nr:uncharacterized protein LOC128213161 [Mya arenaria]
MEEYDNKTLNEVLEKVSPPFEVGLYDEYSNHSMEASNLSLYEAKIMVQSQRTIRMAKVKVIDGEDYDQCDETLAERAYSHDGKEFLIPVNFPGKIKVLKRCPSDVTKPPARFRKKHENVTKISSGQPSGSHDAAESSYETLQTLAEGKSLGSEFQFASINHDYIVDFDDMTAFEMMVIAAGPFKLMDVFNVGVIVGWRREEEYRSYSTVFIPRNLGYTLKVKNHAFAPDKTGRLARLYPIGHVDTDFIDKKLYTLSKDLCDPIFLKSPELFTNNSNQIKLKRSLPVRFQEEDADFTSQYEQPIPAYETYHETPNDSATRYRHLYTESSAATTTTYMSTKFVDISQEDRESIVQPGKTNEDFYKLSVLHLSFLLDYCTLPTLAEECYKRKFDGEFFRSISIDDIELKSLVDDKMDKTTFKRIMDGWRPQMK